MGPSLHQLMILYGFVIWVAGPDPNVFVGIVDACCFIDFGGRAASGGHVFHIVFY